MDYIIEGIIIAASSTGIFGAIIGSLISKAFKKAKLDADIRRNERYESELIQSEYDEISAELMLVLVRYERGDVGDNELTAAEERFKELREKRQRYNTQRLIRHITE